MSAIFTDAVLLRSLVLFLMLGSFTGLLAGACMLWRPELFAKITKRANSWVSTRRLAKPMEVSVSLDNWFYRNSFISGLILLAGAVYIIYMFTAHLTRADLLASLARMHLVQTVLLEPLLDTMVLFFVAGAALALMVSLFLIFRPSMLRDLESGANQHISMRQALKPLEIQRGNLDLIVFRHANITGAILLFASLYTLVILAYWLGK